MLKIKIVNRFKKDLKKFQRNYLVINELDKVVKTLLNKKDLPAKYRDHPLSGIWNQSRECHVKPDVLLIYRMDNKAKHLILERLGSHSDLF